MTESTDRDRIFEMSTSRLRFGPGATREVGPEFADLGSRRVLLVTDPKVASLSPVAMARESLEAEGVGYDVFDRVRIEPSDRSFAEAIEVARSGGYDAFLAIGGGSSIDTAKAANLYASHPAEFLDYVNAPLGGARPIPGPLKPLVAIPTTAGTGSETTGVAVFDLTDRKLKTGIAHRWLKPTLGILDPENLRTAPASVTAFAGLDVLCHALESYTALPWNQRPRPERPSLRPNYQGANPISDVWAERSLVICRDRLVNATEDPSDLESRGAMLLASAYAGMGFGNAGVHLCHAMSYPISSLTRHYLPPEYPEDHPFTPHGLSVVVTAPATFRFTASADPGRHLKAASLLGADVSDLAPLAAGDVLADCLVDYLRRLGVPNGLSALGFTTSDVPALVEGTLAQQRLTKLSPRPIDADLVANLLEESMTLWEENV